MSDEEAGGERVREIALGVIYKPGTPEAVARGCQCPTKESQPDQGEPSPWPQHEGRPFYWITPGCPLHWNRTSDRPFIHDRSSVKGIALPAEREAT